MTIAERCVALILDQPAALAVPELLPVQLATALVATETMQPQSVSVPIFVAADRDLLTAAAAEHLSAENPLSHPEPPSF